MKFLLLILFSAGLCTSSLNFKFMYTNYLIVLELLLKNVKIIYALLKAQTPPLRCVLQKGNRFPLNLFNDGQPISSILMSWRLPKNVCRNRFFSTPLQIICFPLVIVLRYFRVCGKLFSPSFQKILWCVLVNQIAVFRDFVFSTVKSSGGSIKKKEECYSRVPRLSDTRYSDNKL